MEYRPVGRSELSVSAVGLGCSNFGGRLDFDSSRNVIERAIDLGVTFFNTADTYGVYCGSDRFLVQLLWQRRKNLIIATKFGRAMDSSGQLEGSSRRYIMSA